MTKLSCKSCGAKLELTDDIDRFSCCHCGTEWIVNRGGGIVSLKGVEDGINELVREVKAAKTYEGIVEEERLRDKAKAELEREKAEIARREANRKALREAEIARRKAEIARRKEEEENKAKTIGCLVGAFFLFIVIMSVSAPYLSTNYKSSQKTVRQEKKDKNGFTPLHEAASKGNTDNAKLLIDKGADVNAKDGDDWTALHWAVYRGYKDIAQLLIDKGADVKAKTFNGYTPLHYAAAKGHTDIAKLLIDKGADVNAKDNYGRTPLQTVADKDHTEIVQLLRKHGAKE